MLLPSRATYGSEPSRPGLTLGMACWIILAIVAGLLTGPCAESIGFAQQPALDVIYLKNGHSFSGIILQETNDSVHFREVIRRPGKPTYVQDAVFFREDIARIERTDDVSRQSWLTKLDKLDPRGVQEKKRMEMLAISKQADGSWLYRGQWFILISHLTSEELTRRVVVRLEDIFEAFREYFGERRAPRKNLVIILFQDVASYKRALAERGLVIVNPAVYIPGRSEILVFTDWQQLAEQLAKLRAKHQAQLLDLDRYESLLRQHYHGQPPPMALEKIRFARLQLQRINRENEAILERRIHPLFRLCYHESFHAYLDLYLLPQTDRVIPRWLNEGLAQVFETAIVETCDLRVGHIDAGRLRQVQELLKQKMFPGLADLLRSETRHFQVNHHGETYTSDRYFLASWALAYYLLFAPHSQAGAAKSNQAPGQLIIQLLERLANSTEASKVLEAYTGRPFSDLERDWRLYFSRLRPDGTLRPLPE